VRRAWMLPDAFLSIKRSIAGHRRTARKGVGAHTFSRLETVSGNQMSGKRGLLEWRTLSPPNLRKYPLG
jgi:hypothetical protein